MKTNWKKLVFGTAMLTMMAMPIIAKADGVSLNVNLGDDDEAHFAFKAGPRKHHPMIWKAAKHLQAAKWILWHAANDFHGHKAAAIDAINAALDQLKVCEGE